MKIETKATKILRLSRLDKNFSLDYMGKELNVHRETYRKWENNPKTITVDNLIKIFDILSININDFFDALL